jgi:hypothetical protein
VGEVVPPPDTLDAIRARVEAAANPRADHARQTLALRDVPFLLGEVERLRGLLETAEATPLTAPLDAASEHIMREVTHDVMLYERARADAAEARVEALTVVEAERNAALTYWYRRADDADDRVRMLTDTLMAGVDAVTYGHGLRPEPEHAACAFCLFVRSARRVLSDGETP